MFAELVRSRSYRFSPSYYGIFVFLWFLVHSSIVLGLVVALVIDSV
jgi:hypothetical protein